MLMKKYRMPYETFECAHTKIIRKTKPPEFLDPEYYVKAHFKMASDGTGPFFLNSAGRKFLDKQGPFRPPYFLAEENLVDAYVGKPAFIFCPGPSMAEFPFPVRPRRPKPTFVSFAVNSAGFAGIGEMYWIICESGYMRWLLKGRRWQWDNRVFITTARCAVFLRRAKVKVMKVYVSRWEEEFVVPPRTPAVTISNALATVWEMGCSEAYVIGLDQSKPDGQPYTAGVPHTPKGASAPFDDQIRALKQFQLPGMTIYNGSPHSRDFFPNFTPMAYTEIAERLEDCYHGKTEPIGKLC